MTTDIVDPKTRMAQYNLSLMVIPPRTPPIIES